MSTFWLFLAQLSDSVCENSCERGSWILLRAMVGSVSLSSQLFLLTVQMPQKGDPEFLGFVQVSNVFKLVSRN